MDFQTEKPDSLKNNYLQLMEIPEQISETEILKFPTSELQANSRIFMLNLVPDKMFKFT